MLYLCIINVLRQNFLVFLNIMLRSDILINVLAEVSLVIVNFCFKCLGGNQYITTRKMV